MNDEPIVFTHFCGNAIRKERADARERVRLGLAPGAMLPDKAARVTRRMIRDGQRPRYRVTIGHGGGWALSELPWLKLAATGRQEAVDAARATIAEWLEVDPDAFDLKLV